MGRRAKEEIERFTVTRGQHDLALDRVRFLAKWPMTDRKLTDLLANAYLLGIQDAAVVMARREADTVS